MYYCIFSIQILPFHPCHLEMREQAFFKLLKTPVLTWNLADLARLAFTSWTPCDCLHATLLPVTHLFVMYLTVLSTRLLTGEKTSIQSPLGVFTVWGYPRMYYKLPNGNHIFLLKGWRYFPVSLSYDFKLGSEVKVISDVWLFATPWTIQCMKFSKPEHWSG